MKIPWTNYSAGLLIHAKISWKMPWEFSPPWITYQACLNLNTINRKLVKDINSFNKPPRSKKNHSLQQKWWSITIQNTQERECKVRLGLRNLPSTSKHVVISFQKKNSIYIIINVTLGAFWMIFLWYLAPPPS